MLTRRTFLAGSLGALGTAAMPAASWARVSGANDKLRLGVIGTGGRGRYVMSRCGR